MLEWRTGAAGCLLPIVIGAALLFLYWARNPAGVTPEDMHGRGGGIIRIAALADANGIGWGFLALGLVAAWLAVQLLWRFVERVAVTAGPDGLEMRGMFGASVPWRDVVRVAVVPSPKPGIEIVLGRGYPGLFNPLRQTQYLLLGVDTDNGAGARFAAAADAFRTAALSHHATRSRRRP